MYVLINRNKMSFAHKHNDVFTIANLAWIENRDMEYHIFPIDDAFGFSTFTDEELEQLFTNTVGEAWPGKSRNALKQALYDIAQRIEPSKVKIQEVEIQASKVPDGCDKCYQFVPGKAAPKKGDRIIRVLTTELNAAELESALKGNYPALKRNASRGSYEKPPRAASTGAGESIAAPKRGTAKAIIWEVADRMWEEDDKPTDKNEVLSLRKRIMNELEKQGIKRSSSSAELGKWHKERAPF